ncbi:uncharacterized protein SETTUDRAFT_184884 [Exserohilum turcica Et28A]|uniref:Uncharacterized protein n=1 Tax=Exserohilum turcicum (strain 28A) TaxID=671987 RepID=R0KCH0_EXST2|nr:uncharacterized protein SETTUDRAFT_184884 [Exserohilum turcica Et28A]EOA85907.1 hypothetical protein SETTUDRAFT_184884 [Exserohilum turcica Et28A]
MSRHHYLWWLWDPLLEFLKPSRSKDCKLNFTPTRKNNDALSYNITIRLWTNTKGPNIELTATYGGQFNERRIFNAPISTFSFPKKGFRSIITPVLAVDRTQYEDEGCYEDMWEYLMPRRDSVWCRAMRIHQDDEEKVIRAFAGSCRASDDRFSILDAQELQCQNLVRRFPSGARGFCAQNGLVGKTGGPYSKRLYFAPDIKD